jgi:hypothetical protein
MYAMASSPADKALWSSSLAHPGYIIRLASGSNPPDTALAENPMGFFTKGLEGRIDDPKAGWKGRALWATSGNRAPFHIEAIDAPAPGAPGPTPETFSSPLVVEFQLRPDPLAH